MKQYNKFREMRKPRTLRFAESPRKAKFKKIIYVLAIIAVAYIFLSGDRGLLKLMKLKQERAQIRKEISALGMEIARKQKEKDTLEKDMGMIEDLARKELGLVKKDEVVYKFISSGEKKQAEAGK